MTSPHHGQEIEPVVPNFDRFYEQERQLPQHDLNTPYPEGKNGRYLYVSNQHKGKRIRTVSSPRLTLESRAWVE